MFTKNTTIELTQYLVPKDEVFNLLGKQDVRARKKYEYVHPITHIKNKVTFTIMTEDIKFPENGIPAEVIHNLR